MPPRHVLPQRPPQPQPQPRSGPRAASHAAAAAAAADPMQLQQQQRRAADSRGGGALREEPGRRGEGEGDGTCAVCLADFEEGEAVRVLPECAHCFHVACIDAWLRARTSCPVCRAEIAPPPLRACHVARGDSLPHRMPPPAAIL
uniref:RING-type domain-containing protein n=1 Tax=Ananas comosus var. bracteatus TaxID=296719 RepID=A0A6V7NGK8_ANACO|nr:unnamed protein product [Ananas comosus var. bracteatus]